MMLAAVPVTLAEANEFVGDVEAAARAWYEATEADNPTAARWDDEWPADTLWLREEYRARARRFLAAMPAVRAENAQTSVEAVARAIFAQMFMPGEAHLFERLREEYMGCARAAIAADPGRARLGESLRELSTVTAACLRILAEAGLGERLQAELARLGIQDGFGTRAREALGIDGGEHG